MVTFWWWKSTFWRLAFLEVDNETQHPCFRGNELTLIKTLTKRRATVRKQVHREQGDRIWRIFRLLSDCLLWTVFWKLHKQPEYFSCIFFPHHNYCINCDRNGFANLSGQTECKKNLFAKRIKRTVNFYRRFDWSQGCQILVQYVHIEPWYMYVHIVPKSGNLDWSMIRCGSQFSLKLFSFIESCCHPM
jgi:hypothetical protein